MGNQCNINATVILKLICAILFCRTFKSTPVHPQKAQEQPKTTDPVHHIAAACFGEKISSKTVSFHRRKSGIFQFTQSY